MAGVTALVALVLIAQRARFQDEVDAFGRLDQAHLPLRGQILFVGSSSFTRWATVNQDLPGFGILNRAFGGSTLLDQIRFAQAVVAPYHPRQIVMYCGENDLAEAPDVDGNAVCSRFRTWFKLVRKEYPTIPLVFVSMKPSPSRVELLAKMREGNQLIRAFLAAQPKCAFVDVSSPMLDSLGNPRTSLFGPDHLHMNNAGYALWVKALGPVLLRREL